MNVNEIWTHALSYIRQDINTVGFNTYIKDLKPISYENDVFKMAVSTEIKKNMILLRYSELLEKSISKITASQTVLEVVTENSEKDDLYKSPIQTVANPNAKNLNPKYTFDNFVVGSSNKYATAVAQRIAETPGQNDNPFYLYGHSGLGKTHLIQAIGNEVARLYPNLKILYVTSEHFTTEMIDSIRNGKSKEFRHKYREVDVLMIDDIQFIEGKEATQEEIFHTFNDLHQKNKQLIFASDRKPKDLKTLDERLKQRFEWGFTIDINVPDYETRMAILKKKAEIQNTFIPEEVLTYIAERINSNIRELEGALLKTISYSGLSHKPIDIPLAKEALRSLLPDEGYIKITPQKIINAVATYFNITPDDILGTSKMKNIVIPRQIAMYLCKTMTDMNYVMIAKALGNKDRTTIMHGVDKIIIMLQNDDEIKSDIEYIQKDLNSL